MSELVSIDTTSPAYGLQHFTSLLSLSSHNHVCLWRTEVYTHRCDGAWGIKRMRLPRGGHVNDCSGRLYWAECLCDGLCDLNQVLCVPDLLCLINLASVSFFLSLSLWERSPSSRKTDSNSHKNGKGCFLYSVKYFMALFVGFHNLFCLLKVRKTAWFDYNFYDKSNCWQLTSYFTVMWIFGCS